MISSLPRFVIPEELYRDSTSEAVPEREFREEASINPEVIDSTELSVAAVADVSLKVNENALSDVLVLLSTDIAAKLAAVVCATVAVIDVCSLFSDSGSLFFCVAWFCCCCRYDHSSSSSYQAV